MTSDKHQLAKRMATLAQTVALPNKVDDILATVTATAVELIPGADTAGVLLIRANGKFESVGDVTELPAKLDALQHDLQEGPCTQAALADTIVRTDDFRSETRWPRYAPAAVELGVLSGLSFKLFTAERTAGALNLFASQPHAFDADAETVGAVLAAHAAAAIQAGRHDEQMQAALASRDRIGQAKGIIMERYAVDEVRAFEMLRLLSQESNDKLVDIAHRVIETRGAGD
ncbi:GAF and ANTAR domain-containing protein [Mycobacterium asiaticum]|uniref:Histidine kinase n=1 Tax=Mycobacterium asiaticum TaxID=1790 RepID=A0A1A3BZW0_MYCAS|nr:GAF and ANTAR domain-containing protein [Mycobacterium asiaticum]OBI80400.1 histidine kinase [Mycobacterium asiaticum]